MPIDSLVPNDYNPNRMTAFMYGKAIESIQTFGFIDPITVVEAKPGRYLIVDGEHRWRAATDLGFVNIPVVILDGISAADLPRLTIILNELKGQSDPTKLSDVLGHLISESSVEEVLKGLPFTEDILKGYLGFRDLKLPAELTPDKTPPSRTPKESFVERIFRVPNSVGYLLDDAIARVKEQQFAETGEKLQDWQALERIVAEYMAS